MAIVVDAQWSEPKTNSSEDIEAANRRLAFEVSNKLHRSAMNEFLGNVI